MSFPRHVRSIGPMGVLVSCWGEPACRLPWAGPEDGHKGATEITPLLIVHDESHRLFLGGLLSSRARLRFTGWVQFAMKEYGRSRSFQRTANSGLTGCLSRGVHPRFSGLRYRREMKRIPQVLQLPVIIDWGRLLSSELQRLQKLDFLFGRIATQGPIL